MLPQFLQSSYARYKADTSTFATWLLETANQCGYQPPGMAAALNIEKESERKDGGSNTASVAYSVTVKDLRKIAWVIAGSALPVPKPILKVAKLAIELRREVNSCFLGKGESRKNDRHAHFVTVLEEICDILEWKSDRSSREETPIASATSKLGSDARHTERCLNKFAALSLEEPLETIQIQSIPAELKKEVKVKVVEEETTSPKDKDRSQWFLKAFCLLQDLKSLQHFISTTWWEFQDGQIDLMNAAVVTDTALKLALNLVEDIEDAGKPLSIPATEVQNLLYGHGVSQRAGSMAPSNEDGLPYNKDMADLAEKCYLPTRILLDTFAEFLQPGPLPVFMTEDFGTYDARANREHMSLGQKFQEDKAIFLSILPEFCMIEAFNIQFPAVDTITRRLADFTKSKSVTLWLSFASQVFLDIHHIMRDSPSGAFGDLRLSGLRIQKIVGQYFQLSRTHPPPRFWPMEGDQEIQNLESIVNSWIIQDVFQEFRCIWKAGNVGEIPEKHVLLSQHAVFCGMILFNLNIRMQNIGQQLVNRWYAVPQLAFLHNLVTLSPMHKDLKWPDMDVFLEIHEESRIFFGSRPKSPEESLNRLELAMGISSAENFSRKSRGRGTGKKSNKKIRVLKPTAPIANMLFDQYMVGLANDPGFADIEQILNELSEESNRESRSNKRSQVKAEYLITQKWSDTHCLDPLQLLAFLKAKLYEEEPLILYNYFGMHKRAIELLRLLRDKEHDTFVENFTSNYLPDESCIVGIVLFIHHLAQRSAQTAERMRLVPPGAFALGRIVISVGDTMRAYLEKNGEVARKELRVFCRNKRLGQDDFANHGDKSDELLGHWLKVEYVLGSCHSAGGSSRYK